MSGYAIFDGCHYMLEESLSVLGFQGEIVIYRA